MAVYISHRGNLTGPNPKRENTLDYIDEAINAGFVVEVDVWGVPVEANGFAVEWLWLGHDAPTERVGHEWLLERSDDLILHCKNKEALVYFNRCGNLSGWNPFHYFVHDQDIATLTSEGIIWANCGQQPIIDSIAVLPERYNETDLDMCCGICSDYIVRYKELYEGV